MQKPFFCRGDFVMKRLLLAFATVVLSSACCSHAGQGAAAPASTQAAPPAHQEAPAVVVPERSKYVLADAHLHLADFLQKSDGIKAVLAAMDRTGVKETMITGMPLVKKWEPQAPRKPLYYLEDDARTYWYSATDVFVAREVQSLPNEQRKRFHPFITGFNGTDMNALDHVKRMMEWFPGFWQGIGEVMARHDDLTALTYGDTCRANAQPLGLVYEFAADHDMPVTIHSDAGSVWRREPIYLPEIETAVKEHPRTRFIWAHAGISRRIVIPTLIPELRRMLKTYKNLWIDISWVVFDDVIAPHGQVDPAWVALIENFPTRFMIGSDKVGKFDDYASEIVKYDILLDRLKPATAAKLAHDNFVSVLPQAVRTSECSH
jgi:hypothetical protein